MKKAEVYLKPVPKDIIELAKDHTRMSSEIGHLLLLCSNLSKFKDYTWLLNKSSRAEEVKYISGEIKRLYEENKKLKEELANIKGEIKDQQIENNLS